MVGMPIPEMLDIGMRRFDRAEQPLLVIAVLQEERRRALSVRTRLQNAVHFDIEMTLVQTIDPKKATARLVSVIPIAFVKHGLHYPARDGNRNCRLFRSKHEPYS